MNLAIWRVPARPLPMGPVLFLDRDGVVVEDRHYLAEPDDVALVAGAAEAMAAARRAGFALVGVSNQSGIGRGRITAEQFAAVMVRLDGLLAAAGASFDAFAYCPHAPDAGCACRKPAMGQLDELRAAVPWLPEQSWVVGDKESDVALGRRAGLRAIHVATGHGTEEMAAVQAAWGDDPLVLAAADLPAAVQMILAATEEGR
ncbi:MAG: HAD-IIIA family hydrolase [bacterium]|nr:HAD-IIIA family hydrolase [bacterium]